MHPSSQGAALERLARRQDGVVSYHQLLGLGYSPKQILRLVAAGHLHRLHRGVYVVGHRSLSHRAHLIAALTAAGDTSFLSHRTSIAYQGLRVIAPRQLELTVVSAGMHHRQGLMIHRTRAAPAKGEVIERFGLRYSSLARALMELSLRESPDELMRLINTGVGRRKLSVRTLRATLIRHNGRPGTARIAALAARYLDPTDRKSGLERSFDAHAATDSRIPPYWKNVHLGPFEFDCHWPEHHVLLELDGRPYHSAIADRERDDRKTNYAQANGLLLCRVSDIRWELDRAGALDDLLALLAAGQRRAA